jgi:hypothetical protein
MARLLAAAVLLTVAAAPAFACDWGEKSASTDIQKRTVASQPTYNHSTPSQSTPTSRKSS